MNHLRLVLQYTKTTTWQTSIREVLSKTPLTVDASYRVYTPGSALALALGPRRCAALGEESPQLLGLVYAMHIGALAWAVHNDRFGPEARVGCNVSVQMVRDKLNEWCERLFVRHVDTPEVCRSFVETAMVLVPYTVAPEANPMKQLARNYRAMERDMDEEKRGKVVTERGEAARELAATVARNGWPRWEMAPAPATMIGGMELIAREGATLRELAICANRIMRSAVDRSAGLSAGAVATLVCSDQWAKWGHVTAVGDELWKHVTAGEVWGMVDELQEGGCSVMEVAGVLDMALHRGKIDPGFAIFPPCERAIASMRARYGEAAVREIRRLKGGDVEETRAKLRRLLALVPTESLSKVEFTESARVCAHSVMASSLWRSYICCPWNEADTRARVRREALGELRTGVAADLARAISQAPWMAQSTMDTGAHVDTVRAVTRRPVCQAALTPVPGHLDRVLVNSWGIRCYIDQLEDEHLGDWQCLFAADYGLAHASPDTRLFSAFGPRRTEWLDGRAGVMWMDAILERPALLQAFGRVPIPAHYELSWSMFLDTNIAMRAHRDPRVVQYVRSMSMVTNRDKQAHVAAAIAANPRCLCHIPTSTRPGHIARYVRMYPHWRLPGARTRAIMSHTWTVRRALREMALSDENV